MRQDYDVEQDQPLVTRRRDQDVGMSANGASLAEEAEQGASRLCDPLTRATISRAGAATSQQDVPSNSLTLDGSVQVCRVETIIGDRFTATFSDPNLGDKRVRFLRSRVPPADRPLLKEGAVFYWIRGTARDDSGNVLPASAIRFRRTPSLSPSQADALDRRVEEVLGLARNAQGAAEGQEDQASA
jgi:hypothetical protein